MNTFNARFSGAVALLVLGSCDGAGGAPGFVSSQSALTAEQCAYFDVNGKTQVCHATSSAHHPYTILKVSEAACVDAHANHADDYVAVDDPTCQGLGCLPADAPCDATVPCCDGLSCTNGTCVAPPSSQFTEFPIPTLGCFPHRITVGSDGNLWFSEPSCNKVGRITMSGEITEFPIPTEDSGVFDLCLGPDGNVWFTETIAETIGKITPAGVITEYRFAGTNSSPPGSRPDPTETCGSPTSAARSGE